MVTIFWTHTYYYKFRNNYCPFFQIEANRTKKKWEGSQSATEMTCDIDVRYRGRPPKDTIHGTMMPCRLWTLCCVLLLASRIVCRPSYLSCNTVGSATSAGGHGSIGTTSGTTLTVSETLGGAALSRTEYIPGETLYVAISSTSNLYAIEVSNGASFDSGSSCSGARKTSNGNEKKSN